MHCIFIEKLFIFFFKFSYKMKQLFCKLNTIYTAGMVYILDISVPKNIFDNTL